MFIHNFKYSLKTLFKNKMLIFWTFAFPIVLGTFFNMAFSNIENSEKLNIIDIAIVNNENFNNNMFYKESFSNLSDKKNENQLFNIQYVTEEEASNLLKNDEITGYLLLEDSPQVVLKENGINETIFKYVVEEISETENILMTIATKKMQEKLQTATVVSEDFYTDIYNGVLELIVNNNSNIKDISNKNLSYTMVEYYTLIAMTCLYGGILGMTAINQNLANMSNNGKRIAVSPSSKGTLVFSSLLASFITQLIGLLLLFIYTIFVLKVDYGNDFSLIVLLAIVGSLAGLSLGLVIACVFKTNENTKTGIIIAITMFGCFLSGMMGITMKYLVDKNAPIINKLNPASMITDGFYSLYYYDTLDRFYFNIISLLLFSGLMIIISIFSLRRQKYDSI